MFLVNQWRLALAIGCVLSLVGCGNPPPKCGDEEVTSLVLQVFQQAVDKEAASMSEERLARFRYTQKDAKPSLETITVQAQDEKASKTTCQSTLRVSVPAAAVTAAGEQALQFLNAKFETVGARVEASAIVANLQYTAQRTENAKELEVTVQGHRFAVDLLHEVALLRFFDKPFPPESAQAPSAPAVAAPTPAATTPLTVSESQPATAPAAEKPVATTPQATALTISSSLCKAEERAVFACSTAKKQVALCASGDLSLDGQLSYRLSPLGQAPEMSYPDGVVSAKTAFKRGTRNLPDNSTLNFVSFDKAQYRYVIYGASGAVAPRSGVAVEKDGKRVADLACVGDAGVAWMELNRSGIPTDSRGFDLQ
jgi:hypothetical protein